MKENKKLPVLEATILRNIPAGAEHPKNSRELASETGINMRLLRSCVRRLIINYGIPIIATRRDGGGYFIPRNRYELNKGIMPLMSQHKKEGERIQALLNADLEVYQQYLDKEVEE